MPLPQDIRARFPYVQILTQLLFRHLGRQTLDTNTTNIHLQRAQRTLLPPWNLLLTPEWLTAGLQYLS